MSKLFKKSTRTTGTVWVHVSKPVWIVKYDAIKNVRAAFYQAYRSVQPVPAGRKPWAVDNRAIGGDSGFPSLAVAMRKAA